MDVDEKKAPPAVGSVSVCLTRFQIYSRLVYSLSPNHNCCNLPASTAHDVIW